MLNNALDVLKQHRLLMLITALLILSGSLLRFSALLDQNGRLQQMFVTEDGYLMLTIARNMAIGNGMTIADGEIQTNGVQPLATFIYTAGYLFTGGDKDGGIFIGTLIQMGFSLIGAWLVFLLVEKLFRSDPSRYTLAWLASGFFIASPHLLPHTMNHLETIFHLDLVLLTAWLFIEDDEEAKAPWSLKKTLGVGVILGLGFWGRNDFSLVIFAACVAYMFRGLPLGIDNLKLRFRNMILFGATSVVVASPWMISNYLRFGFIMPISGKAQGISELGQNSHLIPAALLEYLMVVMPVPSSLQAKPMIIAASIAALALAFAFSVVTFIKASHKIRSYLLMGWLVVSIYAVFYGYFFGAPHFISRYLIPTVAFLGPMGLLILRKSCGRFSFTRFGPYVLSVALLLVCVALQWRIYDRGDAHQHFQVVNWVQKHVPEDTWIGAIQTGTLGYYHDRTVNLDGKVNPDALAARLQGDGAVIRYLDSIELQYVADWYGLQNWWDQYPIIQENYRVKVADEDLDLAVLQRKGAPYIP